MCVCVCVCVWIISTCNPYKLAQIYNKTSCSSPECLSSMSPESCWHSRCTIPKNGPCTPLAVFLVTEAGSPESKRTVTEVPGAVSDISWISFCLARLSVLSFTLTTLCYTDISHVTKQGGSSGNALAWFWNSVTLPVGISPILRDFWIMAGLLGRCHGNHI